MKKRVDKIFSERGVLSRSECERAVRKKEIAVDGITVKSPSEKVEETAEISYKGEILRAEKFSYIMLNKPQGVVSASKDGNFPVVTDILPDDLRRDGLFPCGRLDKDTEGLVILTNDGESAHRRLSPKNHVGKVYFFTAAEPLTEDALNKIRAGVMLKDGFVTKPCKIVLKGDNCGEITLTEGKYHEIKRIFGALGNKITYLKRISFGGIALDDTLGSGEARRLTPEEVKLFTE